MILHELSCHKGRLLLSSLVLENADPNDYAVPGVDCVVSHESLYFADQGHKAFLSHLCHLLRITHALVSAHCNVHRFTLPPFQRGQDQLALPKVDQRAQCEGLEGLTQLPTILLPRTWVNRPPVNAPDPLGWHHTHVVDPSEENASRQEQENFYVDRTEHGLGQAFHGGPSQGGRGRLGGDV